MAAKSSDRCVCPNCAQTLTFKNAALVGEKVACPHCKKNFVVPDSEQADEERPRTKKSKKKAAQSNLVLFLALGGGLALFVVLIASIVIFFMWRNSSRSPNKDQELVQTTKDANAGGVDGRQKKDAPIAPKGGPGVKLDELPTWTPDKGASADLDPSEQQFYSRVVPLRMRIPTRWREDPQNSERRDFGPYAFQYKFAEMWLFCNSGTAFGLTPGKRGPREILGDWMTQSQDDVVKKAADKIELGRSGEVAFARCFVLSANPPTLFWAAGIDSESLLMRVTLDTRVPAAHHETLSKLFEASILTIRK
jgi:hypothetical protein